MPSVKWNKINSKSSTWYVNPALAELEFTNPPPAGFETPGSGASLLNVHSKQTYSIVLLLFVCM